MQYALSNTKADQRQDNFAHWVRTRLLDRGWNLTQLAKTVRCHRNSIRFAERGLAPRVKARIQKILAA